MKKYLSILIVSLMALTGFSPNITKAATTTHPAGTLVQSGSTIWKINDAGTGLLSIESPEKFYSNRLYFYNAVPANSADLSLPVSGSLPWGDGVLFSDNNIIYQVSGGKKHGFVSAEVFLGQGFKFEMTKPGDLSKLSTGEPVRKTTERHLPGTLVNKNGTVLLQTSTSGLAFPEAGVFHSHGGNFAEVVPANVNDKYSTSPDLASYRTGSIVNDNGALWAIKGKTKLGFPTASCFLNFGFTFTSALTGSTKGLDPDGTVCGEANSTGSTSGDIKAYTSKTVATAQGNFTVKMETFNLASGKVRVITDTAADGDCTNNCPVASLQAYLTVNGGQAGMNGTYFCPTSYAGCAGKTNTFFWKVLDSGIGKVINANNGLGDEDPFITFDSLGQAKYFARFKDYQSSGFKAYAGINSASIIANGNINLNYAKLDEKQKTTRSTQGALGLKGQTLYLIHVLNATVPNQAAALQALGLDYAILLDGGGSAAMMYDNAYKTGPGRNIPNALVVKVLP